VLANALTAGSSGSSSVLGRCLSGRVSAPDTSISTLGEFNRSTVPSTCMAKPARKPPGPTRSTRPGGPARRAIQRSTCPAARYYRLAVLPPPHLGLSLSLLPAEPFSSTFQARPVPPLSECHSEYAGTRFGRELVADLLEANVSPAKIATHAVVARFDSRRSLDQRGDSGRSARDHEAGAAGENSWTGLQQRSHPVRWVDDPGMTPHCPERS